MFKSTKKFYRTYSDHTLFIIVCFILFWPLALFLIWKHKKWSAKARSIVTSIFIGFTLLLGIIGYNAPPYINLSDEAVASNYKTDDSFMIITGKISTLHNPKLAINDKPVVLSEYGDFNYKLELTEGDTDVRIVSKSDKGVDSKQFKVHRSTTAELAEKKAQAEKVAAEQKRVAEKEAADKKKIAEERALKAKQDAIKTMPDCDGKKIIASCKVEGAIYKTYVYHPAVAEKTHTVTDTTYKEEVTGYCTLCNDGTYSPSCATGRGACSWHGGVAQWNAPRTSKVPVYSNRVVVDTPAVAEYYEKVLDPSFN